MSDAYAATIFGDPGDCKRRSKDIVRDWVEGLKMDFSSMFLETLPLETFKKIELETLYAPGNRCVTCLEMIRLPPSVFLEKRNVRSLRYTLILK